MFEYTLPAEDGLIKTNKKNEKMGRWNIKVYKKYIKVVYMIYKSLHLSEGERGVSVDKWKWIKWG